jgi:hypothetical protein
MLVVKKGMLTLIITLCSGIAVEHGDDVNAIVEKAR